MLQHRDTIVWGPSKKWCHPNSWQLAIKEKENKHFCLSIIEFTIYPSLWGLDRAPAPAEGFGSCCPTSLASQAGRGDTAWHCHLAGHCSCKAPQQPRSAPSSAPGLGCQQCCQPGGHLLPRECTHWKLLLGWLKTTLGNIKITPHSL